MRAKRRRRCYEFFGETFGTRVSSIGIIDKIDFSVNTYGRASLNSKHYAYLSIISIGFTRQLD